MSNDKEFKVVVFPGDGIGLEVTAAAQAVLAAAHDRAGGFRLIHDSHDAGGTDGTEKVANTVIELLRSA